MSSLDCKAIMKRHDALKESRRESVENVWRDCFDYTFPIRGQGFNGADSNYGTGASTNKQNRLMDSTAADSVNILASNIMSGLTPSNSVWFALDVGNETDEERRWLDESAELVWENIHMANFDAEAFECCTDVSVAGMFALFIDEDPDQGGLNFAQWPLAQCYFGSTRSDGRVDIVHREYTLTAEQCVTTFGAGNVGKVVADKAEKGQADEKVRVLHCIFPRKAEPGKPYGKLAKNLPFASYHVILDGQVIAKESGYHEWPLPVPRWTRIPGSVYAVGPMYAALPNVRTLNALKELELASADIAVSGMWIAEDDGVLNARTVKLGPKKIVVARSVESMKALETGANFALSEALTAQLQAAIRKIMMADHLQPQDGPQMTATEVHVRVEMIRKLLGPIYGRLMAEYLRPLIERCFGLAFRAGIFKPPPQSLADRDYSVRYVSPMARAQKLDDVNAIEMTVQSAAQIQPMQPDILDELDLSEALRLIAEGRGAPSSIRRTKEAITELRDARAEAQRASQAEQASMAAQSTGMQEAAKQAAVA